MVVGQEKVVDADNDGVFEIHGGLTGSQWGFCILFGFLGWVWQLVLNVLAKTVFAEKEEEGNKAVVVKEGE